MSVAITGEAAEALMAQIEARKAEIAKRLPDTEACLQASFEAKDRLRLLGWRDGRNCPSDGRTFIAIQWGSTGVFRAHYHGKKCVWLEDDGDLWPAHPDGIVWREADTWDGAINP